MLLKAQFGGLVLLLVLCACGSEETSVDLFKISDDLYARQGREGLSGLSECERTFLCVWQLEAEVNNGGFDQFFFNSAGNHAVETVAALEAIGAPKTAALVLEANSILCADGAPKERGDRQRMLTSLSQESTDRLEQLDQKFYQYVESLESLLRVYVERHRAEFR